MWIITAWQRISPEVTMKGYKKCCISNAMDETDDSMLCSGSEEDRNMMMLTENGDSDTD